VTLVRRAAVAVSGFVVRHAAAGSREWAEGLAREVEVIESDWRALGWALGSTRILLEPRQEPLRSLEDVPRATQNLVELVRGGFNTLTLLMQGPVYALVFFHRGFGWRHFGAALLLAGSSITGVHLLLERRRLRPPWKDDVYDDPGACALFYRRELALQQTRMWIPAAGALCFFTGLPLCLNWLDWPGAIATLTLISLCCTVLGARFSLFHRANQQRLDELNRLLAQHSTEAI
jgi:hypothetical protein